MSGQTDAEPLSWDEWQPRPVGDGDHLWRYMSLAKLFALLGQRKLWFARADLFPDKTEGSIPYRAFFDRRKDLEPEFESAHKYAFKDRSLAETKAALESSIRRMGERTRARTYLSCWSLDTAESHLMWLSYAPEGVAVQTSARKIRELLPSAYKFGRVEYVDFANETLPREARSFFAARYWYKPIQFAGEKEVRPGWYNTSPKPRKRPGIALDVPDLEDFIEMVIVAPFIGKWLHQTVADAVARYLPGTPVVPSRLDEERHY